MIRRFDFEFASSHRLPALVFGVTPSTTGVVVSDSELVVRFGPWRLRTPLSNVATTWVTGDYAWVKTVGPAHLSFSDRGVTFATTSRRGLCITFHEPVRGIDPTGTIRHPGATVTVTDPHALATVLRSPAGG